MKYRKLGASDLMVSEIAFGSWLTFSTSQRKDSAIDCVHRALDRGITLFDTANVYAGGGAERVLGEALKGIRRDRFVLATKLFFPMSDTDRGLSRAQIHKQIDASLERLGVSYVDLYQCHRYDADTPLEETMQALTEVVRAGKARYIGFSEWPIAGIEAAQANLIDTATRIDPIATEAQPALKYVKDIVREQYQVLLWTVPLERGKVESLRCEVQAGMPPLAIFAITAEH